MSSWHGVSLGCVTVDFAQKQFLHQRSLENSSLISGRIFLDSLNSQSSLYLVVYSEFPEGDIICSICQTWSTKEFFLNWTGHLVEFMSQKTHLGNAD